MKSPTAYINKGFTLVEILVVVGLVGLVIAIGSLVNINFYTRELSFSEEEVLIGVLQNARSRSMNNVNAIPHGVHYKNGDEFYEIFSGNSYPGIEQIIISRPKSENTTNSNVEIIKDGDNEWEILFDQLSGDTGDAGFITITSSNEEDVEVEILSNGLINW
jgi:prepilin-type N-terminal cleavage/methylation domain-containing protein